MHLPIHFAPLEYSLPEYLQGGSGKIGCYAKINQLAFRLTLNIQTLVTRATIAVKHGYWIAAILQRLMHERFFVAKRATNHLAVYAIAFGGAVFANCRAVAELSVIYRAGFGCVLRVLVDIGGVCTEITYPPRLDRI